MKILPLILVSFVRIIMCETDGLCFAVHEISSKFLLQSYDNLRIVYATDDDNRDRTMDFLNDFLILLGESAKIIVDDAKLIKSSKNNRNMAPSIIFLDHIDSFRRHLSDKLSGNAMKFRKFHIIILSNGFIDEIDEIFETFWKQWIFNVNVIGKNNYGEIQMMTFFPFKRSCGTNFDREIINEFDLKTKMWKNSNYFPKKLKNLKNCTIKVGGLSTNYPSVILKTSENGVKNFSGFEIDIIKEIGKRSNAFLTFENFTAGGTFLDNGTITSYGMLPAIMTKKIDIAMGCMSLQLDRTLLMTESHIFTSVPLIMVVPPGKSMSGFKKLVKPFSDNSWILLATFFILVFIFILMLQCLSRKTYNFVIGENISQPMMSHVLVGIFGLSSHVLPKRNFSRFVLMKFLILCLVIRSIYQGKLFTMLQSELKESNVETLEDVNDRDMIYYAYESMFKRLADFKYLSRVKMIKNSDLENFMLKTLDPHFDGIVFNYITQPLYLNGLHYKTYSYKIASEVFVRNQFVFYLQQNHFFVETVNMNIERFIQSGLVDKWISKYVDKHFLLPPVQIKTNQPLSFTHLAAVFYLLIIGQGLSMFVFMIEKTRIISVVLNYYHNQIGN